MLRSKPLRVVSALLLLSVACRRGEVARDLVREFPRAEVVGEPGLVDLGTPSARRFLRGGWSVDESGFGSSTTFVWSLGPLSTVEFLLPAPRDLAVRLRGAPLEAPGGRAQVVTAILNGSARREVTLGPRLREYRLVFPAAAVRTGLNRLELRYAWTRRPHSASGTPDERDLAVAWDSIRFEGLSPEAEAGPRADLAQRSLFLPWDTSLRYYFKLPPGSRLSLGGLRGGTGGRLDVRLERDGGAALTLAELAPGVPGGPASVDLPGEGVVRLTLQAIAQRAGQAGGIEVLAPTLTCPPPPASPRRTRGAASRPLVVVYVVDTLRADHLGCFGYPRPTSPRIDAFAREGVRFENAVSEASWTRPAIASLFTGLSARAHGVNGRSDALPPEAVTVAEILRGLGYETAAFTVNGNISKEYGFDQGFKTFELLPGSLMPGPLGTVATATPGGKLADAPSSEELNRRVFAWLRARTSAAPLFLYVHPADPHCPYRPPRSWQERFAPEVKDLGIGSVRNMRRLAEDHSPVSAGLVRDLLSLYDAEVAFADTSFGALLDELKQRGLYDDALVFFLSDHGEEFHDHGNWEHGRTLYAEVVRVPLILKLPATPGGRGRRVEGLAQLADVLPTVLDLLGETPPPGVQGRSLRARLEGGGSPWSGAASSYLDTDAFHAESFQAEGFKLIRQQAPEGPGLALYDVVRDPRETRECSAERPVMAGYLASLLEAEAREAGPVLTRRQVQPDARVLENLRALGYVQ